jgi:uncharacterized protein (TIGR02391 family)
MTLSAFSQNQLEQISRTLADAFTHSELSTLLAKCTIPENGGTPKWERTFLALAVKQQTDHCGNNVAAFIQSAMDPVRFVGRQADFTQLQETLNRVLAFAALQLGEDGKLREATQARTLPEAEQRAGRLRSELQRRQVHSDVLRFCRAELLQENYFHAVFEATKSVAQKIRDRTGLTGDGAEIVDEAFRISSPLLAINSLRTETEQSEQKGFANLLKGMFGTFRNVTGHAPKIMWSISEQDALDLLTMVSYLQRRLDEAAKVPRP